MPRIVFSFRGWCDTEITRATNSKGEPVDVSNWTGDRLAKALEAGEIFISLGDHLYSARKNEIEMFDFEEH